MYSKPYPNKIKILKNLPIAIASKRLKVNTYSTSRAFKVIETFAYLKSITTSGKIFCMGSTDSFYNDLAYKCKVSRVTFYNRLNWLKQFDLIKVDKQGNILLKSWDTIAIAYKIQNKNYYEITINENTPKLEYILKALVIAEIKKRQSYKFANFISNNQMKENLKNKLGDFDSIESLSSKIVCLQQETFKNWSEGYDFWHSLRADFNCNLQTLCKYFNFTDLRSMVYLKRKLKKLGLIEVTKRKFVSKTCIRKPKNVFTGNSVPVNFFWDKKNKIRVWQQPDEITVKTQ